MVTITFPDRPPTHEAFDRLTVSRFNRIVNVVALIAVPAAGAGCVASSRPIRNDAPYS